MNCNSMKSHLSNVDPMNSCSAGQAASGHGPWQRQQRLPAVGRRPSLRGQGAQKITRRRWGTKNETLFTWSVEIMRCKWEQNIWKPTGIFDEVFTTVMSSGLSIWRIGICFATKTRWFHKSKLWFCCKWRELAWVDNCNDSPIFGSSV